MFWNRFHPRRSDSPTARRRILPVCEALEHRTVLNGPRITAGMGAAVFHDGSHDEQVHESRTDWHAAIGTIAGRVTNTATGRGVRGIRGIQVQLIDSSGDIVRRNRTNARGQYRFRIIANGPYVVHEVTPRRLVQTSPTFVYTAPQGPPVTGKWNFKTGNTNPAAGAVGPYGWNTIARAGNLPFESPINISSPPINLGKYLTISYNDTQATIANSGHDIEAIISSSSSDVIDVGGQQFELRRFHFHDPSEDQVYGKGYSMEVHFVNVSPSGAVTVLAVFLQPGAENRALQPILDDAPPTPGTSTTTATPINLRGLLPSSMQGWFFQGSLTTPPLSQPINWFVFATPITLNSPQLNQYEQLAEESGFLPNARPIQPLDGRQVNEFNYDVNFQSQSVAGLSFTLARRPKA